MCFTCPHISSRKQEIVVLDSSWCSMYQRPIMIACEDSVEAVVVLESSTGKNICAVTLWWIGRSRDHENVILAPAAHLDCHKPHRVQWAKQRCPLERNRMQKRSSTTTEPLHRPPLSCNNPMQPVCRVHSNHHSQSAIHCFPIGHTYKTSKGSNLNHRGAMARKQSSNVEGINES